VTDGTDQSGPGWRECLFGLVLWAIFMITGAAPLAWVCVCLIAPIAGLGMTVLLLGLPSPRSRADAGSAVTAAGPASGPAVAGGPSDSVLPRGTVLPGDAVLAGLDARGGTTVLDAPAGPVPSTRRRSLGGMPVVAIAAHGVFITVAIMFVLLAAIGAA
jgi:hypothetical protein